MMFAASRLGNGGKTAYHSASAESLPKICLMQGESMRTSVAKRSLGCGAYAMALLFLNAALVRAQEKHAITFDNMISMHRISEAELSPDGKWAAYTIATPDMEANRNATNIWMAPVAGGDAIQLTRTGKDSSPKWSPDGKTMAFLSARSGDSQVYLLPLEGGEAHPITKLSGGADIVKWSPDGKAILFTSAVFPDCKDEACNKKRDEENEKNTVKENAAEGLLYGQWTTRNRRKP